MYADFRRRWAGTLSAAESYPASEVSGKAERSHPTLEARGGTRGQGQRQKGQGGDREEQPHAQG